MGGLPFPKRTRRYPDLYANPESTFHLVFRAMPETTPFRGNLGDAVWALALDQTTLPATRILAACLMPNHIHLIARPGEISVVSWVNNFKSYSTRRAWAVGWRGPLWQPSFYDHQLRSDAELETAIQYVLSNPTEAGLSSSWPWLFERPDRAKS